MKSIVPLFRQNTGRVNLGLVNWDSFQAGFRMLMRGDKFAGVTWDPWWHERKSKDRRKEQQRTIPERRSRDKTGHRLYSEGESVQPLRLVHDRRTNWKRRDGSERRKSASREKLISFEVFIRELRNGALSDENARLLIRLWAGLTTREVYDSWIQNSTVAAFFKEPAWEEKENREKFTEYAVASFLDLLRPGTVFWKGQSPNPDNMRTVSRIASVFVRATPKARLQAVRAFIEGKVELEGMRKTLSGKSLTDKKELLQLVWSNRKLKPKAFYEKLRGPLSNLGIKLSSKPNSYRKQIERLNKDAELYVARLSR
jgi:hypothetical protein